MSYDEDLVAVTEEISADDLELSYKHGVFPWPIEGQDFTPWFCPQQRGLLFFEEIHISKSLAKLMKKEKYKVSFCQKFSDVLEMCAQVPRKGQEGTWINKRIKKAYLDLFNRKKAYSVEVWNAKKELVGGLYGVISDRYVSGESMFFLEDGASKVALVSLAKRLEELGLSYLDTQMVTPLLESFGAREVSKKEFMKMIKEGIILKENFFEKLSRECDV